MIKTPWHGTKKQLVERYLNNDIDMGTYKLVRCIKEKYGLEVSARSIQRVRKEIREKGNCKNMENVHDANLTEDSDVFNTDVPDIDDKVISLNGLSDEDIIILNLANEGGWTIEDIAKETKMDEDKIRTTLINLKDMVQGEVLDEENPEVYLTTGTKGILEDLDALPATVDDKNMVTYTRGAAGAGKPVTNVTQPVENFWEVKQDCVSACSKVDQSVDVFMSLFSRRRAMLYMKWAGAREWLAYLVGEYKDGAYYITDLYLPDQRTSSALVDKIDNDEFNHMSIVGVIHSHHEMGAGDAERPSFSGHDDNFINSNHNLSLLAGRDRVGGGFKIVGIARVKTPCDAFMKIKANIRSMVEDPEGDKLLKDEFLEKTQTQTHTYQVPNYQNGYGYGWNPYYNKNYGGAGGKTETVHPTSVSQGKTLKPGANGVVETRGRGFHFSK